MVINGAVYTLMAGQVSQFKPGRLPKLMCLCRGVIYGLLYLLNSPHRISSGKL